LLSKELSIKNVLNKQGGIPSNQPECNITVELEA